MDVEEKENIEEAVELTVDLSEQALKKIERPTNDQKRVEALILDHNDIQRLDNLDYYSNLRKLSLVGNQVIRMYGVSHLTNLEYLDLSSNSVVIIEGLNNLKYLKDLNLSKNRIKTIQHLNCNLRLERIDLSDNSILHVSDISFLDNLKELHLHGNRITHLRQCEKNLPENLEILTLNNNSICDLNEVSHLGSLQSLRELSFTGNPCVDFSDGRLPFNYRPFIKNWCVSLLVLDNCPLDDIECLKAEWLYSQGRGRSFRPGEHAALTEYLASVCPYKKEQNTESEDVRKLKLILSKAQQHQQQLREQLSSGSFVSPETPKATQSKKKPTAIPDRMVTSFQDSPSRDCRHSPEIMTRSLDSGMLRNASPSKVHRTETNQTPLQSSTTFIPIPDALISPDVGHTVQSAAPTYTRPSSISSRTSPSSSRNSPHSTPESKRKGSTKILRSSNDNCSPIGWKKPSRTISSRSSTPVGVNLSRNTSSPGGRGDVVKENERIQRETSEEEDSEIVALKLGPMQQRERLKRQRLKNVQTKKENCEGKEGMVEKQEENVDKDLTSTEIWKAAVCIQKLWRGYRARNLNGEVISACKNIQMNRVQDYITKVVSDMEATRIALEGNRKLQALQMQAINALWKKMTALQPAEALDSCRDSKATLENLVETCSRLYRQVEDLQTMMKSMQKAPCTCPSISTATQTELVAVHTPQGEDNEKCPYCPKTKSLMQGRPGLDSPSQGAEDLGVSFSSQEGTKDSENGSLTDTFETVVESDAKNSPKEKATQECLEDFLSDSLTKPAVKLKEPATNTSFEKGDPNGVYAEKEQEGGSDKEDINEST